jgi:hypothetical protein
LIKLILDRWLPKNLRKKSEITGFGYQGAHVSGGGIGISEINLGSTGSANIGIKIEQSKPKIPIPNAARKKQSKKK